MRDVLEEMRRYSGRHTEPPPIRGIVLNHWIREVEKGADDLGEALREIDRLKEYIEHGPKSLPAAEPVRVEIRAERG